MVSMNLPSLPQVPPTMTRREVAEYLQVHDNTVANMVKRGQLKAVRMRGDRGAILIDRQSVIDYVKWAFA